ncbi:LytR C-terminal domain-containing protein [Actinophytocola sediminis]
MTTPEPSPARPLRVAGLVLLGVAAVSLVIGLVSLFGNNGNGQAERGDDEPTPTSNSAPADTRPPESSEPEATKPAPSTTTGQSPTSQPGTSATPPAGGDGNGEPGKTQQVRVYNNSTISGLAGRAADELKEAGWPVADVGNYSGGKIPTTTVYFRPGTEEQRAAELLADEFGMRVEPRYTGIEDFEPGLIVIVTNDYQGPGGERAPTEKNDK